MLVALPSAIAFGVATYAPLAPDTWRGALAGILGRWRWVSWRPFGGARV